MREIVRKILLLIAVFLVVLIVTVTVFGNLAQPSAETPTPAQSIPTVNSTCTAIRDTTKWGNSEKSGAPFGGLFPAKASATVKAEVSSGKHYVNGMIYVWPNSGPFWTDLADWECETQAQTANPAPAAIEQQTNKTNLYAIPIPVLVLLLVLIMGGELVLFVLRKPRSVEIKAELEFATSDGGTVNVPFDLTVFYRQTDPARTFRAGDIEKELRNLGRTALRVSRGAFTIEQIRTGETETAIAQATKDRINNYPIVGEMGIEITQVTIQNIVMPASMQQAAAEKAASVMQGESIASLFKAAGANDPLTKALVVAMLLASPASQLLSARATALSTASERTVPLHHVEETTPQDTSPSKKRSLL